MMQKNMPYTSLKEFIEVVLSELKKNQMRTIRTKVNGMISGLTTLPKNRET
jgi:hypothetical protein